MHATRGSLLPVLLTVFLVPLQAFGQAEEEKFRRRGAVLREKVTDMTGLKFKHEVPMELYSKDQLRKFLVEEFKLAMPDHVAEKWERIGYRFGFWGKDFKLVETYLELLTDNIAGFYHPRHKELKIITNKGPQSMEEKFLERTLGVKMRDVYLLHELFHAAQDQNFGLTKLKTIDAKNDDMLMAFESLIEGEATLIHYRYMFKQRYGMMKSQLGRLPPVPAGKNYPRILYHSLVFPYTLGFRFIDEVVEAKGWKTASRMFKDLPLSTEMVLHPEKYIRKDRDYPTVLKLRFAKISKRLGASWDRLDDNVHGEFVIRLLFSEFGLPTEGEEAAAGWDGDRYTVYRREKDGRLLGLWISTWDTEKDAKEFISAYTRLLEKKYDTFERTKQKDEVTLYKTDDGLARIERRGKDVLVLEGADEDALKVADPVWKHLQKEELREFKPKAPRYF